MEKMQLRQAQSKNGKALRRQLRPLSENTMEKVMKDKTFFSAKRRSTMSITSCFEFLNWKG